MENSDKENITQNQTAGVVVVDDNKDSSISVNGGGGDGGSENDGFVSGDDESETPAERPGPVYSDEKFAAGEVVRAPFVSSEEFFTPKAGQPNGKASVDVDDRDGDVVGDSGGDILGSDRVEQGGGGILNLVGEDTVEKSEIGAATGEYVEDAVQTESIEESDFNDRHEKFVEDSGSIDNEISEGGKLEGSMPSVIEGGIVAAQHGLEFHNSKNEEAMKEQNNEILYDEQQAIPMEVDSGVLVVKAGNNQTDETEHSNSLFLESAYDNCVENDAVKCTSAGDSVVDTLQVNLLPSGAAVVGDKENIDGSEIKGMEAPASGVSLDNGFDPIERDVEEPFDKFATSDAKSDQNVNNLIDDDTKHADRWMHIAPLEKGGHLDSESQSVDTEVKPLQDDINVEALPNDGESGGHVKASVDECDTKHAEKGMHIASPEEGEKLDFEIHSVDTEVKPSQDGTNTEPQANEGETGGQVDTSGESLISECVDPNSSWSQAIRQNEGDKEKRHPGGGEIDGSVSNVEADRMIFGSEAARFLEELEKHSVAQSSQEASQRIDGQIVTDSDEEVDTDEEGDGKELFDSAGLAALLKAATGTGQDDGNITINSQDGVRLFSVERPAGLGPSLQSVKPAARPNHVNLFTPSNPRAGADSDSNLSEEEKKKLEKVQQIRIKFLRLVHRLGFTSEESIAAQILYQLTLVAGRQSSQLFSLDDAKRRASQLEAEGRDDLEFSLNILVIGKTGVGKSATINSIFGETKTSINAYGPATSAVTEIVGMVDGVKIRIFDTPGLKSSAVEQNFNRKVLSMVKKFTKKSPPDIVLYVDRLDIQTRNLNDLPLLKSVTNVLGFSIWQNAIVTLTHAASAPPEGPSGSQLGYDVFVAQRSHIVQQSIGQAVGDLRLMNPSLMNPVSLVENHPSCRKNRDGEKVLPNGQSWRLHLMLLCHSMKILSEAGNLSKTQDKFDNRRQFGFRVRSPPLSYLLQWLLQSHTHPKLPSDQGVDIGDSDIDLADLSDTDLDNDEDEYDQLPPFKPLRKSQIAKLSREQSKAYFEEYDYRVKLFQKKQWREELKRMREMRKKGKTNVNDYSSMEEDDLENGSPAAVPVPLPDMVLPPSFDSENPAYRYRFLEPTSQLLTRPVLDIHGWDHDSGYDGVNLENSLAIINKFPAAITVQITKDKKDFTIHLDSSVAAKHGENGSTMAGFDIQNVGKLLAYICRGETKFKNFKKNKTVAGVSVTFLGENVSTGLKLEDQIALGKRLVLVGSTGTVRSQGDSAFGANIEVRIREADFPIGQDQASLGLSLVKWRGDLALGANFQSQFSIGRSYKMAVRAGLNNKLSGQIAVRTSSSDQLQIALLAVLPIARAIYKNFWPGASEKYSIY